MDFERRFIPDGKKKLFAKLFFAVNFRFRFENEPREGEVIAVPNLLYLLAF